MTDATMVWMRDAEQPDRAYVAHVGRYTYRLQRFRRGQWWRGVRPWWTLYINHTVQAVSMSRHAARRIARDHATWEARKCCVR